jgi:precorrin-4 methylase
VAEKFRSYYQPDLPIAVIYYAGYTDKETVLRSTLATIDKDISAMNEKWLGLVVIGECVR